jgi:protein MYSM1
MVKRHHHYHHQYYGGDDFARGYDPFRLVPTEHYSEETPAPFEVEINSDALVKYTLIYIKNRFTNRFV